MSDAGGGGGGCYTIFDVGVPFLDFNSNLL